MAGRKSTGRRATRTHRYPRTARLNQLFREIIAEELERIDDDRLTLVAITDVFVDSDLHQAIIYYDSLNGEVDDEQVLEAFADVHIRLKTAIGKQARIKRTPELIYEPDPAIRAGAKIESLLASVPKSGPIEIDESKYKGMGSVENNVGIDEETEASIENSDEV